jgi:hypothetical protein
MHRAFRFSVGATLSSAFGIVVGAALYLAAAPTNAALLAYEPFEYNASTDLNGQTNGTGFKEGWAPGGFNASIGDRFRMQSGSLQYRALATRGSSHLAIESTEGKGIAGMGRLLSTNLEPVGVYYLSFLFRPGEQPGFASIVLGTGDGEELSIGKSSTVNQFHLARRGGRDNRVYAGIEAVPGKTVFLAVKMELKEGMDKFTLHIDPKPGEPEPKTGTTKDDFDLPDPKRLFLYSTGSWSVDEIRIGTTWADVTPAASR